MFWRFITIGGALLFLIALPLWMRSEGWARPEEPSLNPTQPYTYISEKNIFSPGRKEFPILTAEEKKPLSRPQVILYGVTMTGDYQSASIVYPGRSLHKGERETFTIKTGESIGEYKVVKILPDRITLEANGDSFDILLYDPKIPKKRIEFKTETKPAPLTNVSSAPATPLPSAPPPVSPPAAVETIRPSSSVEVTAQEKVTPPTPSRPSRPFFPSPEIRRRRPSYPPSGTQIQGTGGNQ